ncbi:hypothetical protein [Actinoplanes sp. DH11]|uniref:hypothetical protein n=1 Tax=Actinoplanes sp. DH11 TaxID=2857011 RepID=UPI001E557569|nr:hypothetical protein [Actinoplanes sp. DH11]
MTSEHITERPQWDCRVCGLSWPCPAARGALLTEYRDFPSLLRIYLTAQMYEALGDLTALGRPPSDLHDRFLTWTRDGPPPR